jgi:hypothetical protein
MRNFLVTQNLFLRMKSTDFKIAKGASDRTLEGMTE